MIRACIAGLLIAAFVLSTARAHDAPSGWAYPVACCSGDDCAEIASSRVKPVSSGYLIDGIHVVLQQDVKHSPDGAFHACFPTPDVLRCFVADVKRERRRQMTSEQQALFGIDKLNVARSEIPAVTHVDYSARVQTVHADTNPRFHALISRFKEKTGCPVLINTSFNVRSEPIVCSPEDAFRCFMGNDIELLVVGNCMMRKSEQNPALKIDYKDEFEPD